MTKKYLLFFFVFILLAGNIYSQGKKFTNTEDWWHYVSWDKPTVELSYGFAKINLDGFSQRFENTSKADIKLGYASELKAFTGKSVVKYINAFAEFGGYSNDLDSRIKSIGNLNSNLWQLGLGKKEGYKIRAGNFSILPYTSNSIMWSRLDMKNFPDSIASQTDFNRINLFNKSVRFGSNWEGGINIGIGNMISLQAGYERLNVYQRYLFWKNTGSQIIEQAGLGMLDEFIRRVLHDQPVAGSIVNFILKNAYEFGIYQLRSKQMNWPFGGEASLNFDTYKFGLGFRF
jgi:hypothetical protein